jgi:hypothetical protein
VKCRRCGAVVVGAQAESAPRAGMSLVNKVSFAVLILGFATAIAFFALHYFTAGPGENPMNPFSRRFR